MKIHLSPAERVYKCFGTPSAAARHCDVTQSSAARWNYPKEKGGCGGLVPQRHHQRLVNEARAEGLKLRLEDFIDTRGK